jgi:glycosyltransferase involved in cell wall biosynthesis
MEKKYSILFLIDSLTEGGAELALLVLVRALHNQNHYISVFALREPTGLATAFRESGATLHLPPQDMPQGRIDGFKRLRSVIKENYFDFIHASSRNTSMFLALGFLLPSHGRQIVTFQEVHFRNIVGLSKWQLVKEVILLAILQRTCVGFTTDSHKNVQDYNLYNPSLPIIWIPNCLVPPINGSKVNVIAVRESMNVGQKDFLIIVPARYSIQKGHIVLFNALKHLLSNGKILPRVVCYGEGDQFEVLSRYLQENRLDSIVSLNKVVPIEKLQASIIAADLVAMPSLWESFGQVVAGAMALGKPVLGSNTGGIKEQIEHDKTGFLAPPGDTIAWATAIDNLMNSKAKVIEVGKAGQESVHHILSSDQIAEMLVKYYMNLS